MQLQSGQNVPLSGSQFELALSWKNRNVGDVDVSCFALASNGKVRTDDDFVFFNAPKFAGGGVVLDASQASFRLDLDALPSAIEKLAFTLTLAKVQPGQTVAGLGHIQAVASLSEPLTFALDTTGRSEVALIVCEIYLRNGAWKFRAQGQGFNGGLKPLAESFGVVVDQDEAAVPAPSAPPPSAPPPPSVSPPPPLPPRESTSPAPSPLSLSKITLEKKGESISLEKKGTDFGTIVVNLNWTAMQQKKGLFGRRTSIDLDLGCLIELADGQKGCVQALGNNFGSLTQEPYIQLDGDDRTGGHAAGETIRINGSHWNKMRRVLIFAFIYKGVSNWAAANGSVTVKAPGQADIEVRLDSHSRDKEMCAVALLENRAGGLQITKLVEYFSGHDVMDKQYNWGLRWAPGAKD